MFNYMLEVSIRQTDAMACILGRSREQIDNSVAIIAELTRHLMKLGGECIRGEALAGLFVLSIYLKNPKVATGKLIIITLEYFTMMYVAEFISFFL